MVAYGATLERMETPRRALGVRAEAAHPRLCLGRRRVERDRVFRARSFRRADARRGADAAGRGYDQCQPRAWPVCPAVGGDRRRRVHRHHASRHLRRSPHAYGHHALPGLHLGGDGGLRGPVSRQAHQADHVGLYGRGGDRRLRRTGWLFRPAARQLRPVHRVRPGARHVQGPECARRLSRPCPALRLQRGHERACCPREPMAGPDADPAARIAAVLLTRSLDQSGGVALALCLLQLRHGGDASIAAQADHSMCCSPQCSLSACSPRRSPCRRSPR